MSDTWMRENKKSRKRSRSVYARWRWLSARFPFFSARGRSLPLANPRTDAFGAFGSSSDVCDEISSTADFDLPSRDRNDLEVLDADAGLHSRHFSAQTFHRNQEVCWKHSFSFRILNIFLLRLSVFSFIFETFVSFNFYFSFNFILKVSPNLRSYWQTHWFNKKDILN